MPQQGKDNQCRLKPFVINSHGRIVFPGNFFPELDFSVFKTLKQFAAVIRRDFGEKAPTDVEIAARVQAGEYKSRYELCRDLVLNRFWVNRYTLTMYEKRPTRWGDLPRQRDDIFLPVYKPRDDSAITTAIEAGYRALPPSWDEELEDRSFSILLNVFRNKLSAGGELRPIRPTVSEALADPANRTRHLLAYDPDYLRYTFDDVIDCLHPVPELEALMRQCMILHNQYPWDPSTSTQTEIGKLKDDDYVVAFHPRNEDVLRFIQRVKRDENWGPRVRPNRMIRPDTLALSEPIKPYPPVEVSKRFKVLPRIEAIAVYEGEVTCSNADLIRNHAYCWSRMSAAEISEKTGIEERRYTQLPLEDMALLAAKKALAKSGRRPAEIGAVLFCTCTSTKLIPSIATWLSGELGLMQTHTSCDIVAACAGMPYGLGEAVRLLQEIERPVLLVCAEKFSDKIGTVRTSRMIFGDGAAAVVVAPAPEGTAFRHRVFPNLCQRSMVGGELHHLAQPGVRQQHYRLRAGGEGPGHSLSERDDGRVGASFRTPTAAAGRSSTRSIWSFRTRPTRTWCLRWRRRPGFRVTISSSTSNGLATPRPPVFSWPSMTPCAKAGLTVPCGFSRRASAPARLVATWLCGSIPRL